jgi:beta-N-acetylhexosaminidase
MNKKDFIDNIIAQMTIEQKIGQCVVVGMSGTQITNDLREAITKFHCGGVRLSPFARIFRYFSDSKAKQQELGQDYVPSLQKMQKQGMPPYLTPEQYAEMLNELKELAAQRKPAIPLHMVIDQEGDTSKDFSRGGVVQFPSNMGMVSGKDPEMTYKIAKCIAKQMKASGLDMIHSPVVDVNINPNNPEIGYRAFSDDPKVVAEHAIAMVKGFKEEKVIAAAKHFPGRGDSATDAHHACPSLDVDSKRFHEVELYPYKKLIEAGIDSIMIGHCIYPQIDPEYISTVSRKIVTGVLREELGFKGLITTDSMTMGALIDRYGIGDSCAMALAAGADVILMKAENQWRGEMFYTIKKYVDDGRINKTELDEKVRRILSVKYDYGMFDNMGKVDASKAAKPYTDKMVVDTVKKASRKAILIAKDELKAVPLNKNQKILLVNQQNSIKSPIDFYDHPALFQELMEAELPNLQTFETNFGRNDDDETGVVKFVEENKFDLIICTNFYDRADKPHEYVRALIDKGYPVLLITNTPYCFKGIGGMITEAKTIILNMNLTPEGYRTICDVLFGKIKPEGSWPLSNFNPLNLKS